MTLRALHLDAERGLREDDPPALVPPRSVVALQPHGSLFFASAPRFESLLPRIEPGSVGSVVILRLRGTPTSTWPPPTCCAGTPSGWPRTAPR